MVFFRNLLRKEVFEILLNALIFRTNIYILDNTETVLETFLGTEVWQSTKDRTRWKAMIVLPWVPEPQQQRNKRRKKNEAPWYLIFLCSFIFLRLSGTQGTIVHALEEHDT